MTTPAIAIATDELTISRVVNGTPEQVWDAFTQATRLAQWWGPPAVTVQDCQMDVRVDGHYRIVREHGGVMYPLCGEYRVLAPHHRLVMTMDCREHPAARPIRLASWQ